MESAKYTQRNKEMFKNEESRTNTTKTKTRQTQKCSPSGRIANGDASGDPNPDPGPVNGDSKGSPAQSDAPRKSSDRDKVKWRARVRAGLELETRRSAVRVRFDDELVRSKPCRALSSVGENPPESWPRLMSNGESACGDGMGWALRCAPSPSPRSPGSLGASGIWRRPRTGLPVIIEPSGYGVSGSGRVVLGASRGDSPPFRAWRLRCDHVPGAGGTRRGSLGGVRGVRAIWSMGVMGWLVVPPEECERRMKEAEARVYVGVKPQGELKGDVDADGTRGGGIER